MAAANALPTDLLHLLQEAKDKLRITWTEQDTQVARLVVAAITEINETTGKEHDYEKPGLHKTLMLEHVFYNWNNALAEFYREFSPEITELSLRVATEGMSDET